MSSSSSLKSKLLSGFAWKTAERIGMQAVSFLIQIVLARLLSPSDFGTLALVTAFIAIAQSLVKNGLSNALIQKKDSDKLDECTVFFIQLGIAGLLVACLFFGAPVIAEFYGRQELTGCIRAMSLIVVFDAVCSIQQTVLTRDMQFRKSFYANLSGTICQGLVGIACAFMGLGYWSLILSYIANSAVTCMALIASVRWKPSFIFSLNRLKHLFSYGWKLSVAWFIGTAHQQIYSIVIGRSFDSATLGFYNRAQNLPSTVSTTLNQIISSVLFSGLSKEQDDILALKAMTRKAISMSSYLVFPVMFGFAAVSYSFIDIVYTAKWLPAAGMMQLFCIQIAFSLVSTINMQSFNALGKPEVFMNREIIRRGISIALLIILSPFGIDAVVAGLTFLSAAFLVANAAPNKRLLGYGLLEYTADVVPSLALSFMMFLIVTLLGTLPFESGIVLLLQIISGVLIYCLVSALLKMDQFDLLLRMLKLPHK